MTGGQTLDPYVGGSTLSNIDSDIQNLTRVLSQIGQTLGDQQTGMPVTASTLINTGASADQSSVYAQPTTGFSITIPNACSWLNLDPAGTLAAGTVVMPTGPIDGQNVVVSSTEIITALTVDPSAGQTVKGAPTTIAANSSFAYRYRLATATWYRLL